MSSNHARITACVSGAGCCALLIRIKQQEDAFSVRTVEHEQQCSLEQTGAGTKAVSKSVPFRKNCALEILCPPCYGRMYFFKVFKDFQRYLWFFRIKIAFRRSIGSFGSIFCSAQYASPAQRASPWHCARVVPGQTRSCSVLPIKTLIFLLRALGTVRMLEALLLTTWCRAGFLGVSLTPTRRCPWTHNPQSSMLYFREGGQTYCSTVFYIDVKLYVASWARAAQPDEGRKASEKSSACVCDASEACDPFQHASHVQGRSSSYGSRGLVRAGLGLVSGMCNGVWKKTTPREWLRSCHCCS